MVGALCTDLEGALCSGQVGALSSGQMGAVTAEFPVNSVIQLIQFPASFQIFNQKFV